MSSATLRSFLGMACLGLFGLGSTSCGSGESNLLIGVSGVPSRNVKLLVKATLDGRDAMATQELTSGFDQFGVVLPADASGHLALTIQSLDSDGCIQASGVIETDVPQKRVDLSVQLTAKSPRQCGVLSPCAKGLVCSPSPKPPTANSTVWGMWETAPNDIWAVGDGGLAVHFDGTSWQTSSTSETGYLNAVWASGPSDVWAVGTVGTILHYDGQKWSHSTNSAAYDLNGVFGVDSKNVWTVGSTNTTTPGPGEFYKWDGTSWKPISTGITGKLYGVWASSPTDIYACGVGGLVLHSNGSNWTASNPTSSDLRVIWGMGANLLFTGGGGGTVLRNTGSVWSSIASSSYSATLNGLTGDSTELLGVGNSGVNGNMLQAAAPFDTFTVQHVGGNNLDLNAVVLGTNGIGWVAGKNGFLAYFDTRP